jgi:hypothetical protein
MRKFILSITLFILCVSNWAYSQDDLSKLLEDGNAKSEPISATFKTTRLNMAHSVELVNNHHLDFRVSHVFGEMGKTYNGGIHNFYGFDVASNIRIAFEYGVTKNLTIAVGRNKGFGKPKEVYDGHIKYRFLQQTIDNKMPITAVLLLGSSISTMKPSTNPEDETSYTNFSERVSYATQLMVARKFSSKLSLQIMPTWIHRNYTAFADESDLIALGAGGRFKFSKRSAIIIDYFYTISKYRNALNSDNIASNNYFFPLGIGYEVETGGHVFHMSLVNSGGFVEQDFIPNSPTSWTKFGIRFGFNISRQFRIF